MALNGLSARLTTFGYWGTHAPGFSLNFSSESGWERALSDGRLRNLELLAGQDARYGKATGKRRRERSGELSPILIASRETYPAAWNAKSAWSRPLGGTDYLEEFPAPFRSGTQAATPGLGHTNGAPNTPNFYISNEVLVPSGAGFIARIYQYKPGSAQKRPQLTLGWGRYQLQIADGRPALMMRSASWTQTKESQLYALLTISEPSGAQQEQIDALREEIYSDEFDLNIGSGGESWYGAPFTIEVAPGAGGSFYVLAGGESTCIKPRSADASVPLWGASPLSIRGEGGAYFWQIGCRQFVLPGKFTLDHYVSTGDLYLPGGNAVVNINGFKPPGTDIAVSNDVYDENDDRARRTFISLTTSNSRFSPLFSALSVDIAGSARDGGRSGAPTGGDFIPFDSNDTDDPTGHPIMEVTPSFEDAMRRAQYVIQMRDIEGKTLKMAGFDYGTLEHQVGNLEIGGTRELTNGIIKDATATNFRGVTPNQVRAAVANANSGARLTMVDPWFILDEMLMRRDFIGDHQRLGLYLRMILLGAGFTQAEVAGISETAGRVLPGARANEDWIVRPGERCYFGDYLRDLVHKWGAGWMLFYGADGVWRFQQPSTAPVAAFSRNRSTPGAHIVYRPLDLPREVQEFYNEFIVEGEGEDGNPIVESFAINRSISRIGGGPPDKTFIGRRKTKVYSDGAIRNRNDALWVVRSLREYFGLPPRYAHFESDRITGLFPGKFVTHDGVLCRAQSITGGSAKRKRMNYLLREAA